ncbi:MAG TPA: DUF3105 domain-containing protein [Actinomycetota bacterium]|nr:DUF3105 domain-containing protein [Actinomycetota bacterium]
MSRKLEEKQQRREAEERRRREQRAHARRRNLVTLGIAAVVVALVVAGVVAQRSAEEGPSELIGVSAASAGCTPVEEHEDEGNQHVDEGTDVSYGTVPPTSGSHYGTPAGAGFYPDAIEEERLVHNLEHGQIVIWYRPDAPESTIEQLEQILDRPEVDDSAAVLAAPYDGLDDRYTYALTAWGASQSCARVSEAAINRFRERFQGKGPEPVGVPTFDG